MRRQLLPLCFALWLTTVLTGCGGGSGSAAPTDPGQAPPRAATPTRTGSVLVKVTDTSGAPVAGAVVGMVQRTGDYVDGLTNARGEALFGNVAVGTASVRAEGWGYYLSGDQDVRVVEGQQTDFAFTLEPRNPATVVVLGSRVIRKGADRKTLEFEVDVGVLDESGQALTNLVDAAFRLSSVDCGWGPCLIAPNGGWIDAQYYVGAGHPQAFALEPARNRPPVAVGLLLDQGEGMQSSEPRRSTALTEFLAGLAGSDSTLLAEYRGSGSEFNFAPSGGFVTDGPTLQPLVSGLRDRIDDQASDSARALESMLSHLEQQPALGRKALVAVGRGHINCNVASQPQQSLPTCGRLVEQSRAAGIPITTTESAYYSYSGADIARRTGGASFVVDFPAQYQTVLRALLPVIGGEIPFYRLRFQVIFSSPELNLPVDDTTFYPILEVRVSERDTLYATVVVPL